jgi:integrase
MKLVHNNASGRIYAKLKTGNPEKPYIKYSLGTKNEAEAKKKAKALKLAEVEAALQLGPLSQQVISRLTVGRKVTTEQAVQRWLASGAARDEAPATTAKNEAVMRQWFAFTPGVAKLPPSAITTEHVSAFVNRSDEDAGYNTRLRQLTVIRVFLRYCADMGIVQGNVAGPGHLDVQHRKLSHEQLEPKQVAPFTDAELRKILDNTEGWWRWATAISAAASLRLGDIAKLEYAELAIPGHIVAHTNKRRRRVCLPINEKVTPGLASILAEIPPSDSNYVFPEQAAQYDDVKSGRPKFSVYYGRLLDSLGIDRQGGRKSFHSLRHMAITRWERIGFSLDQCAEYAGHSSTKTTKGYVHQ